VAIRLVVADDHPIVLDGLARLFDPESDCEVVARATDGELALQAVRKYRPDILVLDLSMPAKSGLAVLREMIHESLPTRVVVLTASDSADLQEAIRLGVGGVVLKDMAPALLLRAVREVHAGRQWIEREAATHAVDTLRKRGVAMREMEHTLTRREIEVARMVASGLRNGAVAQRLKITEGTVKLHLHSIYDKLGLDGRMALAEYMRGRQVE
jgi:DNA-binding NarL/FixJ family response regulator